MVPSNSAAHALWYFSTLFSSCLDATLHTALAVAFDALGLSVYFNFFYPETVCLPGFSCAFHVHHFQALKVHTLFSFVHKYVFCVLDGKYSLMLS